MQFPVEEEHLDAAMVSVSALAVMRLDVSYQTIQGRVGKEVCYGYSKLTECCDEYILASHLL